jgi:hypothetical protein
MRRCMILASTVMSTALMACPPRAQSQEPDQVLEQSRRLVEPIRMEFAVDDQWTAAPLIEQPALRFEELSRDNRGGSVWLWGVTGRPAAVMELYQPAQKPEDWCFVLSNLSGGTIRAAREGNVWWQENKSDVQMQPFPDAPDPAAASTARLLQMRSLARRFQAHEFWDPDHSRFNLRLLPQPLHRYDGEGAIDGTLFVFANGTNPEACLLVEARADDTGNVLWNYGLARLGHAEIHVQLDGEPVWRVKRLDDTPNRKPYWLWYTSVPLASETHAPRP